MDLRALRYFVTVAEELNITRAAEKLNMSQPPLSNQMKALEEELGTQLFIRGKRHLTLTDAGTVLYRRAQQLLELSEQTQEEVRSLEGLAGKLNIGLVEGRAPYLLARWISGFRMEFPQVSFSLWNGSGDDVLDRLHHGLSDLALIAAPVLPLKELVGQPLFIPSRRSRIEGIRAWFREIGEEPLIAGELSSHIDAVALAEQNVGICIYPMTTYNDSNLVSKKVIVDSERQIEYVLVWNRNQLQKELAQEFVNFVKDCLEEEQKGTVNYIIPEKEYFPPEGTPLL